QNLAAPSIALSPSKIFIVFRLARAKFVQVSGVRMLDERESAKFVSGTPYRQRRPNRVSAPDTAAPVAPDPPSREHQGPAPQCMATRSRRSGALRAASQNFCDFSKRPFRASLIVLSCRYFR